MNEYSPYKSLKLEDVIESNPPTFNTSGVIIDAIAQMNQSDDRGSRRYSYVLILEQSKLFGIITEPDIVRLTAAGANLATTKIDSVMTTKLITLNKSELIISRNLKNISTHNCLIFAIYGSISSDIFIL